MGGFFVVRDGAGKFWDGREGWLDEWRGARRFADPPDAFADCFLAVSCLRALGVLCHVAYVPRGSS